MEKKLAPVKKTSVKGKTLQINLDPSIYGTFAEIGAGQETANRFFSVGGASGTIAKSISAYDMEVSDANYGKSKRYVSKERLQKMLSVEYDLLNQRLKSKKNEKRLFVFANTIETLNYKKSNKGHGWLGISFQLEPKGEVNHCVIHINLSDVSAHRQRQVIGTIGVNLIYSCYFLTAAPSEAILSLLNGIERHRVEIDYLSVTGPHFNAADNRLLSLMLVKNGLTKATVFGPDKEILQPSDACHKKPLLILRGQFNPITEDHEEMLAAAKAKYCAGLAEADCNTLSICELSLSNLSINGVIDYQNFLKRADDLCYKGHTVMLTNFKEYYSFIDYLCSLNKAMPIRLVIGMDHLHKLYDDEYYTHLGGGLLQAFGILFAKNIKIYVSSLNANGKREGSLGSFKPPKKYRHIHQHLIENGSIESADDVEQIAPDKASVQLN